MKVPGNLWIDVWSTAQAVPVRRQKRLFDDTREAEKVNVRSFNEMIGVYSGVNPADFTVLNLSIGSPLVG